MANRDLIVIGGSAGATAPLKSILSGLPESLPAAVAVTLHVPAESTGILRTVAAAACRLPVKNAEDGEPVRRGQVYLAPPGRHLLVIEERVKLGDGPRENLARPAIDPLFRSAAISFGPRTIGVVLSGMLDDGAFGLAAIKQCGGVALVQAPGDAIASEMPVAALEASPADLIAEAPHLAEAIVRYAGEPPGPALPIPRDLQLEVEIAAGGPTNTKLLEQFAEPVALTCPDCGGVLSQIKGEKSLRFRCQVGHGYTARALFTRQEGQVDEALRVALRIVEERAELVGRMAREAIHGGWTGMARMYERRSAEYRAHAETLRRAVLLEMEGRRPSRPEDLTAAGDLAGESPGLPEAVGRSGKGAL